MSTNTTHASDTGDASLKPRVRYDSLLFVAGCFFVSGFAALLYETVWLRQFAILLGTSEQALAVVLASYMGGLAVGSLIASRIVDSIRRPLLMYGILEFAIALSAILLPLGISLAASVQVSLFGNQPEPPEAGTFTQIAFCFATALGLILIPTSLMGATLPLLARHVISKDDQVGPRIGILYAINTAGAVAGTLVAAFVCLPSLGLSQTTWVGAAANLIVFLLVVGVVRRGDIPDLPQTKPQQPRAEEATKNERGRKRKRDAVSTSKLDDDAEKRYRYILWFAACSGAVSFCYEILFTRMLGHMLGGSIYAFATMLSGFLLGIALGGAIGSRFATSRKRATAGFVHAQAAAAICTLVTYHLIDRMVVWPWQSWGGSSATAVQVCMSILALLPTATCLGVAFPLAIRVYAKDETEAASGAARVFFWNVLGGIFGAMATGAVIMPLLQYQGAAAVAILCNLLLAAAAIFVLKVHAANAVFPVVALLILVGFFPREPRNVLRASVLQGLQFSGDVLFHHVGRSATVTVSDENDGIRFHSNGLPESTLSLKGGGSNFLNNGYWLSSLPPVVRPTCQSMMIIGLGGGVAAENVPPSIKSIDVLELEPAVVEANRRVAMLRDKDPLADPRVTMILNDARNALALTNKKYDAIVSQPSHPWTAGASHLYTEQFNRLVREHLNPGGIFLQWMSADFVDPALVRSMGATLLEVFPHARLYQPFAGTLLFVASDQPIEPERIPKQETGRTFLPMDLPNRSHYRRMGIVTPTHLFSILGMDEQGLREFSKGAPIVTDQRNLLAMKAPMMVRRGPDPKELREALLKHTPAVRGIEAVQKLCPSFDALVFFQQSLSGDHSQSQQQAALSLIEDPVERVQAEASLLLHQGKLGQWSEVIRKAAQEFSSSSELAFTVLSYRALGRIKELSTKESLRLRESLSPTHAMVLEQVESIYAGDIVSPRKFDAELAAVDVDDVAFETALRVRIPWRLESAADEQQQRCLEVLQIIDDAAPFANPSGVTFFRAGAAARANQPMAALATIQQAVRHLEESARDPSVPIPQGAASNMSRCYSLLQNPAVYSQVPPGKYQRVRQRVEAMLRQLSR
ncbi:MAG: fused MFS/spermidine synthase [Rubripirellula sp.]